MGSQAFRQQNRLASELRGDAVQSLAYELTRQCIQAGNAVWLRLDRTSMLPLLVPGDEIEVAPYSTTILPKRGDIIAYQRDSSIVVHRLLAHGADWLLTKGDNQAACDPPVPSHALIGRVISKRRGGEVTQLKPSPWQRCSTVLEEWSAHWSSAPFSRDWRGKCLHSFNMASVPLLLVTPPELSPLPNLALYRSDWGVAAQYNPWIIDCSVGFVGQTSRAVGAEYRLDVRADERVMQMRAEHFSADIDITMRRGRLQLSARDRAGSVENCLRALIGGALVRQNGVLLHAASVVRRGEALLLFGPSGSGKSTLAKLALDAGFTVMSDDLTALREIDGVFYVDGLPFKGSHPQARFSKGLYPLAGAYMLEKGTSDKLFAVSRGQAVAAMLASTPFISGDADGLVQLMPRLERLVGAARVRRLQFRPTSAVWKLI